MRNRLSLLKVPQLDFSVAFHNFYIVLFSFIFFYFFFGFYFLRRVFSIIFYRDFFFLFMGEREKASSRFKTTSFNYLEGEITAVIKLKKILKG